MRVFRMGNLKNSVWVELEDIADLLSDIQDYIEELEYDNACLKERIAELEGKSI